MTPIAQMDDAAKRYPALTALLMEMSLQKRTRYVAALKKAASSCDRPDQVQQLHLILGHIDVELNPYRKKK